MDDIKQALWVMGYGISCVFIAAEREFTPLSIGLVPVVILCGFMSVYRRRSSQ